MMKYPKEYLNEIKLRLKVSQVVGKTVKLKKRGKEYIGLSPFSNEKTPSFTVNDEKGFYHCFSTSEHGNIFDFLMKTKSYKFGEAVRALASEAGMEQYKFTKQDEEKQNRWKDYNSILEKYVNYCHNELKSGKHTDVIKYIKERNISEDEINFFKLGFSPSENNFFEDIKKNFDEKKINTSGIYYLDEKKNKYVDRFRGRIIFPVKSLNHNIFALGGRALSKKSFAKYINSPETEFYKKGNNLYNINSVEKFRGQEDEIFVVEGYMDVISLHKFGIKNVVANLGTAITEKQIDLLWRFFKSPIICLDGDESGQKAALRIAERLFPLIKPNYNIYFLTLPKNFDPDSFVNQKGKESFLELSKNKTEISDFIWGAYFNNIDNNDPHSLTVFEKKIETLCREMRDKTLAKYFLENFKRKINELTPNVNNRNNYFKFKRKFNPLKETKELYKKRDKFGEKELKELSILFLIINNLDVFRKNIELISEVDFAEQSLIDFKESILKFLLNEKFFEKNKIDVQDFNQKFENIIKNINTNAPVKIISSNKSEDEIITMFKEIIAEVKKIDLKQKIENLENKVSISLDESSYSELLSLRNQLKEG